jgi:hypothetical protein
MFPQELPHYSYHGYNFIPSIFGVSIAPALYRIYDIINNTLIVFHIFSQEHSRDFQYHVASSMILPVPLFSSL